MREYIYYLVGFTQIKCMSGEIYRTDTLVIVWKINAYFAKVHQEISCNNCNNRTIKSNLIKLTKICYIIKAYCCLDKSLTGALAAINPMEAYFHNTRDTHFNICFTTTDILQRIYSSTHWSIPLY